MNENITVQDVLEMEVETIEDRDNLGWLLISDSWVVFAG